MKTLAIAIIQLLFLTILAHAILSWLVVAGVRSEPVIRLYQTIGLALEPLYRPLRRVIPTVGMLDLTPLAAIVVGALTPRNQAQIREALGLTGEDPMEDPEFDALDPEWEAKAQAFQERVRQLYRTKTMDEWIDLMDEQGAPATKVNFPEEMADDAQVQAMGYMIDLDHPLTGPEQMVGPILRMTNSPTGTDRPSPTLGQHADEVLTEHGLTADEIASLRAAGALG